MGNTSCIQNGAEDQMTLTFKMCFLWLNELDNGSLTNFYGTLERKTEYMYLDFSTFRIVNCKRKP